MAYYLALWLRFEGHIPSSYQLYEYHILVIIGIKVAIFAYLRLYRSLWEYASIEELIAICMAVFIANTVSITYLVLGQVPLPRSVDIMVVGIDVLFIGGSRFAYRALRRIKNRNWALKTPKKRNVLIVGAGKAGALIVKELRQHTQLNYHIVGIVDDDSDKHGKRLMGVPILGMASDIDCISKQKSVDEIIIAIPSASKKDIKRVVETCKETGAKVKILPGVYELIDEKVTIKQVRDVSIEDLLGREQIHLDSDKIGAYIKDKCIMVTGGGGSIGSELCRQIARFEPSLLIVVDIYENNVYDLQNELNEAYNSFGNQKQLKLKAVIASVRDKKRMKCLLERYQPCVVFHAAAHKHVPLMEDNPYEAVKNNIMGTYNMASLCHELEVPKFVLISTDKAVNPTNVMGATKRFCEMIVQGFSQVSQTEYAAVRFGNVLGSNGSVIPVFKKQIEKGGPVTVTHQDIIRYFMTIPEAAQLVLQAGAMAKGGEIFILDMGEPVRIMDLAKDLIRLSGFVPDEDIPVVVTGLRPGEKLYEELLLKEEGISHTIHKKIYVGQPLGIAHEDVIKKVEILNKTADLGEMGLLVAELKRFVPTFVSPEEMITKKCQSA